MVHPCSYVSGNNRAAPTGWAYGGAWIQNDGKVLTEGEDRDLAESPSEAHKDFENLNLKMYDLAIVRTKVNDYQ